MAQDISNGMTIAFATSSWAAIVTNIGENIGREAVDKTALADATGGRRYLPSKLSDNEISLEVQHDPAAWPPVSADAEAITITYPLQTGESVAAKDDFNGFITQYNVTSNEGELMMANVVIKVDGAITHTDAT